MKIGRFLLSALYVATLSGPLACRAAEISDDLTSLHDGDRIWSVIDLPPADFAPRTQAFNADEAKVAQSPGMLDGCEGFIDIPVGVRDGNHSYGAICLLHQAAGTERVLVCNDMMVGHYAVEPVAETQATRRHLIGFVYDHCFGG